MIKLYIIIALSWVITVGGFSYLGYTKGYDTGHLKGMTVCYGQLQQLKNTLNEINMKEVQREQQQKHAFRVALNVRNEQVRVIEETLDSKVAEIQRLKNETSNDCVNAAIPDEFK
jgi:hypothetical protein